MDPTHEKYEQNMSALTLASVGDPLSEVTRKERRSLLAVSLIGLAVAKVGMLPTKITALGVDFNAADQRTVVKILAWILIYYAATFLAYAASDFITWRLRLSEAWRIFMTTEIPLPIRKEGPATGLDALQRAKYEMAAQRDNFAISASPWVSIIRAMIEFLLPIVFGIYVAVLLFRY